jgi:hypothetical protein
MTQPSPDADYAALTAAALRAIPAADVDRLVGRAQRDFAMTTSDPAEVLRQLETADALDDTLERFYSTAVTNWHPAERHVIRALTLGRAHGAAPDVLLRERHVNTMYTTIDDLARA